MGDKQKLIPSSRRNPCPVCGRTKDSDCRISADGLEVICHHPKNLRTGEVVTGADEGAWAFTGNTRDGRAGHFTLDKPRDGAQRLPRRLIQRRPPEPARTQPAPLPDRPPALARMTPREPGGSPYRYSDTQLVRRVPLADGDKAFYASYFGILVPFLDDQWQTGSGPDPWPVFHHDDTIGAEGWILETEGEKCAEIGAFEGVVTISQPGHARTIELIVPRYQALRDAGCPGVVYLADHDGPNRPEHQQEGRRRAENAAEAAAQAGLPMIVIPAIDLWPGLPDGGSIDDAPDGPESAILDIIQAATEAYWTLVEVQQQEQEQPGPQRSEPPRDQQIQSLLDILLDLKLEPADQWAQEQAIRAELFALGVRGDAIDDRMMVALAARWGLPLQQGHSGQRRGRSITDPLDSPAEDLLPGFLLWRRDHVVFGAGGAGKTMAAAAMAAAVIKGRAFLDQEIPVDPGRRGKVLWIGTDAGEGARAMVLEYLEDLGVADDPEIIEGLSIWAAEAGDHMPPWCCSPRGLLELRDELELGGYSLVVIDSLKAVLELAGINFGIGPVGTLMRFMQALVGRHCSLVWLHHPAGGKAAGKGVQAAAGSQNINQIPSGVHQITRHTGERGTCNEWSVLKLRGSQSRDFKYRLAGDGFEVTDGEITGNARCALLDRLELREASGRPTDTRMLVDDLQGVSEATVRNNLTWLRKQGLIKKAGKAWKLTTVGRNAPRYAL
jgi:hypothetical protein